MLAGNNNEAQAFLTRGAQVIIRMRGLPYDCTAKQVVSCLNTDLNILMMMSIGISYHNLELVNGSI